MHKSIHIQRYASLRTLVRNTRNKVGKQMTIDERLAILNEKENACWRSLDDCYMVMLPKILSAIAQIAELRKQLEKEKARERHEP